GAPLLSNGRLDIEKIKRTGILVPEGHYLVLGDNYAMSADSRDFGFVPENNLRGVPTFIFFPTGARFGSPNQPPYPTLVLPRELIWLTATLILGSALLYQRKKHKLPLALS
ncbi:MAG: signal peptidase I, partial [Chlamydiae bacterium]|nr:signal peptidase I [Chlamydiota bacterium]